MFIFSSALLASQMLLSNPEKIKAFKKVHLQATKDVLLLDVQNGVCFRISSFQKASCSFRPDFFSLIEYKVLCFAVLMLVFAVK